jgi:hypothetical protein
MKASLFFVVLVALSVTSCHDAKAHSIYDNECCSDKDCKPIPFESVRITPEGYHVFVPGGRVTQFVPFNDDRIRDTPAGDPLQRYHVCTVQGLPTGELLCLYVPQGGA